MPTSIMKLEALINELSAVAEKDPKLLKQAVVLEGCDCNGPARAVEVLEPDKYNKTSNVFIRRLN